MSSKSEIHPILLRIKEVIEEKNIPKNRLGKQLKLPFSNSLGQRLRAKSVKNDFVDAVLALLPKDINKQWILTGIGEKYLIRPISEIRPDPNGKQIPVLDLDIYATITPSLSDVVALKPAAFISIPMFSQGEYAIQVTGHSMKGYINHGDWIIIKRITNRASLIYGEPHLVVTKADNIKTVKFIKQADTEENLTLVPYNIEQFDPQDISKDDVQEIWRVIGLFRTV